MGNKSQKETKPDYETLFREYERKYYILECFNSNMLKNYKELFLVHRRLEEELGKLDIDKIINSKEQKSN